MDYCTPDQMQSIREEEARDNVTLDPTITHGCQPYGNAAAAEDTSASRPSEFPAGDAVSRILAPGNATTKSLDAIGDWIENGFDGEEDDQWSQLGRAIPGALAMGPTMIVASGIDTVTGMFGWDPFGD